MSNSLRSILLFFCCLALLSSCRTRKQTIPLNNYTKDQIYQALQNHNIEYDWFTAVGKIRVSAPGEYIPPVKAYVRIEREKAIWMVIKKLNIEFARVLITPEEFTILYRLEKVYEQESFETLLNSFNAKLTFVELQDYLVGNIPDIEKEGLQFRKHDNQMVCQTMIDKFKSFLRLDLETLQLQNFELYNPKNESVKGEYSDFQEVNEISIPFKRVFDVGSVEHGNLSASFNFSEIQINEAKSMKFSVPEHYEKLKYYRPF